MKKKARFSPAWMWTLTGLTLAGLYGCAQEPPPFDPIAAREFELNRDWEVKARPMYPLPQVEPDPTQEGNNHFQALNVPEGPTFRMSLQEIIHRAMAYNMEIRVASFDTAVDQTRVLEADGNFDPTLFSDVNFQRIDKLTGGTEAAVPASNVDLNTTNASAAFPRNIVVRFDEEQLFTSDFGIKQNLPAGGKAELKEEIDNSWFNPPRALLHSWYETDLIFTLTQPLLQNFGVEVNHARIRVAQLNQRVSLLDFRKTVEETVLKVEQTYWQQVQAERDVETSKRLLGQEQTLRDLLRRRLGNDVTLVQVEQVAASQSDREVQLIQQQTLVAQLSDQLKQLMNDPQFPVTSSSVIMPVDPGTEIPLHFNLDDQVETAVNNRFELGQQQARIESAEVSLMVAKNNLLPSLNAQIQATVNGLGHDIGASFGKEGDFNHWGYQFGLQFEYPLGDRAARAIWQRALLQRMQAIASYTGLVNQIGFEVETAARQVDATWRRLDKARESRLHWQRLLDTLDTQMKNEGTALTFDFVFNVVQNQQQLAQAEDAEHLALNDYNFAIAQLEKNKGTILRYNNVIMEQEQLPFDMGIRGGSMERQMLYGEPVRHAPEAPLIPALPAPASTQPTTDHMR